MIFFSRFLEIAVSSLFCCKISLEIFSDKSSQSTSPFTKLKYSGMNKDKLQNLLIFRSSLDDKYVTLKEYVERMGEEKKEILYVVGEDLATVKSLPKMEALKEKGIEVLILTDKIDEFALKTMNEFEGKTFKSISDSDPLCHFFLYFIYYLFYSCQHGKQRMYFL